MTPDVAGEPRQDLTAPVLRGTHLLVPRNETCGLVYWVYLWHLFGLFWNAAAPRGGPPRITGNFPEVRLCGPCAFVRPRVPCVPCFSRLPPVSFYRQFPSGCVAAGKSKEGQFFRVGEKGKGGGARAQRAGARSARGRRQRRRRRRGDAPEAHRNL